MFKIVNKQLIYRGGVDLTSQNPTTQDIQSCMAARYDAGICKHRKEHTGVIEVEKMDVKLIGNMDHTLDNTFESANRVYSAEGLCPTIPTGTGGGHMPKIVDVEKIPKIKIRQATAQGFIECEVGGGSRPELSHKSRAQRQSTGQRSDMSDIDNGEYP